jgi:hypothetical protein
MSDEEGDLLYKWHKDAVAFVEECMGFTEENNLRLSKQQKEFLAVLSEFTYAKGLVHDYDHKISDIKPTERQRELSKKMGMSIMAGKGVGKDFIAAMAIFWFLCTHHAPLIKCTAPTQDQLRNVLWSELARWHGHTDKDGKTLFQMKGQVAVEMQKIYMLGVADPMDPNSKDGLYWSATYKTPQKNVDVEQMKKTLSGNHAPNMMFVLDEASGVHDAVFEDLENTMTGRKNFALVIFNPHKASGFAYESQYGKLAKKFLRFQWSSEESEVVSKQHVENMKELYGEESDNYRVNILGLPPKGGDAAFFPYVWIQEARDREMIPLPTDGHILGIDIAMEGKDSTIICNRKGPKVLGFDRLDSRETLDLANEIHEYCNKIEREGGRIDAICIDAIAVGKGVADILYRMRPDNVYLVKGSQASTGDQFRKLRDDLFWRARRALENGMIDIPAHDEFIKELNVIQASEDTGKLVIMPKPKIIKLLGHSPDHLDAFILSFHFGSTSFTQLGSQSNRKDSYRDARIIEEPEDGEHGFMGV